MATRCATARRAARGISATRTRGRQSSISQRRKTATICSNRIRWTGIAVNATSSQGSASASTAAIKIGKAVASDEVRASTQTISPEVLASAARMASEMRARSCCGKVHHQLPDAPPPPDEPPPPEKPPPLATTREPPPE